MAPTCGRFNPGFPARAGFPGEHLFREYLGAPAVIRTTLEQPHFTFADLFRAGFPGEHVFREYLGAPAVIRTTLEQPHFTFADLFGAGFHGEHFFADF
jgi:hypothetical protein